MAAIATPERAIMTAASEDEVNQVLSRVLNSKYFIHAPKKQKFLRLICDFYLNGRASELNEYLLGREVFDRDEDYNPAEDPIVRVGAHDMRKKLELYYLHEGANDEIRLDIPVGSYEPIFLRTRKPQPQTEVSFQADQSRISTQPVVTTEESNITIEPAPASPPSDITLATLKRKMRVLYCAIVLLLSTVCILAYLYLWPRQQTSNTISQREISSLGPVWETFLKGDASTLLVLSSPLVYRLMNAGDSENAIKNSVEIPPDRAARLTQLLKDNFAVRNSPPNPSLVPSFDTYTGLGEAIGAQRVTDLLRSVGQGVALKRSRTMSAEDLKENNVILLGSVWSNEWSGKLPMIEDFVITGQAKIENHNPRPGEAREYRSVFDETTGKLLEDYALVTVKPNISSPNVVMVLAGLRSAGTEAAAEYVTGKNYLNDLNRRLRELGGKEGIPRFYQAMLRVGVENGIPTTISLIALHKLQSSEQ